MLAFVFRIVLGADDNGTLTVEAIENAARRAGVDGFTLTRAVGWTLEWGGEPVTIIETATNHGAAQLFCKALCKLGEQECAYVVTNGAVAELWRADGTVSTLEPTTPEDEECECDAGVRYCSDAHRPKETR